MISRKFKIPGLNEKKNMDHLVSAIRYLTPKEMNALLKKIKNQKTKLHLLELISKEPKIENKKLVELLSYGENYSGLYTLKNRLFDDIIAIKLDIQKNVFFTTREKIPHLRALVFSKDKITLIRELNKYEKNTLNLELYGELKEIYFCFFLTYKHDDHKKKKYLDLIKKNEEKEILSYQLEQVFYSKLLDTQDLFYFFHTDEYNKALKALKKIEHIHNEIKDKSSTFLYLSSLLTIYFNKKEDIKQLPDAEDMLNTLSDLYSHSFLTYKYPNCHIAIQCLYNKYYFLNGEESKFRETLEHIKKWLYDVKGYQMFDDSIFYFLYVSILDYINNKNIEAIPHLIDESVNEEELEFKSEKMKCYYLYLLALKNFYTKNYKKSIQFIMESRNYFNKLDALSSWIEIENILLAILIYIKQKEFELVESEIYFLKRKMKKLDYSDAFIKKFKDFIKVVRDYEKKPAADKVIKFFEALQEELAIMRLLSFPEIRKEWEL